MVIENRPSKMKFFWFQGIFFVNFDFKNGCKNKFEVTKEKSCSRFKIRVPPKNRFKTQLDARVQPDSLGVKKNYFLSVSHFG